ncbi:TIGR04222 domain-containing membrane protein [Streptomyces sp. NPDC021224]|uniref:TIGR04222 domain-containing membrane protein n=1 Tax=unclassified Streptomyces TaxID=2593676 RepID=UPI0037948FF8
MSGPHFLAVYAAAFVLAGIGTALVRSAQGKRLRATVPSTVAPAPDPYTVAVLSGGRTRVVDTAVHALVTGGGLRVGRDHRITPCGTPVPADAVAADVVAAVGGPHGATLSEVRSRVADRAAARQVATDATARGLLLAPGKRASLAFAALAPMLAVFCAGVGRLGYGVHRHHPVGLLLAELAVSAIILLVVGSSTPRRTAAAERMLEQARGMAPSAAAPAHAGQPAVLADSPLMPAAVMGVALIGAGAVLDGDLRDALFGGLSTGSSGGGGSGCGTDSGGSGGGCGGGGCGGGCGGCGG